MILINFKNYTVGQSTLTLVRTIDIYCNKAMIAVPSVDLRTIVKETTLPVYAQHVDISTERGTGTLTPEALKDVGVAGSLINHSEHKVSLPTIKKTLESMHNLGLKAVVCVSTLKQASEILKLQPYAIAFEDPKLIASGKSITMHESKTLKSFVQLLAKSQTIPLCGAGISTGEDVKSAYELGCKGVLIASAVAHSTQPEKFLKEISSLN